MPMDEKVVCLGGSAADLDTSWTGLAGFEVDAVEEEEEDAASDVLAATGGMMRVGVSVRDNESALGVDMQSGEMTM